MSRAQGGWLAAAVVHTLALLALVWYLLATDGLGSPTGPNPISSPPRAPSKASADGRPAEPKAATASPVGTPEPPGPDATGPLPPSSPPARGVLVYGRVDVEPGRDGTAKDLPAYSMLQLVPAGAAKGELEVRLGGDNPHFAWPGVSPGDYELRVRADAMRSLVLPVSIAGGQDSQRVDVTLQPLRRILVAITTSTGGPLLESLSDVGASKGGIRGFELREGLHVIALAQAIPRELPPASRLATSITIGRWRPWSETDVSPGDAPRGFAGVLEIPVDGACSAALVLKHIVLARAPVAEDQTTLSFVLDPDELVAQVATLRLQIVDPSGQPLPAARVGINTTQSWSQPSRLSDDGRLEHAELPGIYRLTVSCEGFAPILRLIELRPGLTDIGTLRMGPGRQVRVRVLGSDSPDEVAGELTSLEPMPHASLQPNGHTLRKSDGLLVAEVPEGQYLLRLSGAGGAVLAVDTNQLGDAPLEVRVQPEATVTFDSSTLDGPARLLVTGPSGEVAMDSWVTWTSRWERKLVIGAYTVSVEPLSGTPRTQQLVVAAGGASCVL